VGLCDIQKSNIVLVDEIDDFAPKDTPENYEIIRILESYVQFNGHENEGWMGCIQFYDGLLFVQL
jgi:hypothetical protein